MKIFSYVFKLDLSDFFIGELVYIDELKYDFKIRKVIDGEFLDGMSYVDYSLSDVMNIDLIVFFGSNKMLLNALHNADVAYSFFIDKNKIDYFTLSFYNEYEFYNYSFLFLNYLKNNSIQDCKNGIKELEEILKNKLEFFV
jgi:hypothetical protein